MRTLSRFLVGDGEWYDSTKSCSPEHKKCLYLPVLLSVQEFSDALHTQTFTFHLYCLPLSVSFTLPCCQLFWLFKPFTPWTSRPPPHVKKHSPFPFSYPAASQEPLLWVVLPFLPRWILGHPFLDSVSNCSFRSVIFALASPGTPRFCMFLILHGFGLVLFSSWIVTAFILNLIGSWPSWMLYCEFLFSLLRSFRTVSLMGDNIKFRLLLEGVRAP